MFSIIKSAKFPQDHDAFTFWMIVGFSSAAEKKQTPVMFLILVLQLFTVINQM